jgi:hypothetical protein
MALSLFKKETTYDAGVLPFDATTAVQMCGFTGDIGEWEDAILNDAEDITCTDFPTQQEILRKMTTLPYAETKAKPNSIAGLGAMVFGQPLHFFVVNGLCLPIHTVSNKVV